MNPSEDIKRRLHPVAALIGVLNTLQSLVPLLIVAVISREQRDSWMLFAVALPGLIISVVVGIGGWLRFRYWVEQGELRIEKGFLVRRRVFIPADRVQAVDVSAGILQRAFGVVSLHVKTAAAGTQAKLSAISREEAERLSQQLTDASSFAEDAQRAATEAATADSVIQSKTDSSRRHVLTPRRLLLAASTSGRLGVLLSGVAWMYTQVDELVNEWILGVVRALDLQSTLASGLPVVFALIALGGLILAWVASVAAEAARYGGFSVQRRGQQIVISRGIFERREVTVSLERVQAVLLVEGLLRQPLGYVSLTVESAGHAEERGQSTLLHPFLRREEVVPFLGELAPVFAIDPELVGPPPRALRRFLVKPMLVVLLATSLAVWAVPWGWALLVLLAGALSLGFLRFRDAGATILGQMLVLRRRRLHRTTTIVERRRVQYANVSRSWLQRRLRLADFGVGVASGGSGRRHVAPELDEEQARELFTWCAPSTR